MGFHGNAAEAKAATERAGAIGCIQAWANATHAAATEVSLQSSPRSAGLAQALFTTAVKLTDLRATFESTGQGWCSAFDAWLAACRLASSAGLTLRA